MNRFFISGKYKASDVIPQKNYNIYIIEIEVDKSWRDNSGKLTVINMPIQVKTFKQIELINSVEINDPKVATGTISAREYQKEGKRYIITELIADEIIFGLPYKESEDYNDTPF